MKSRSIQRTDVWSSEGLRVEHVLLQTTSYVRLVSSSVRLRGQALGPGGSRLLADARRQGLRTSSFELLLPLRSAEPRHIAERTLWLVASAWSMLGDDERLFERFIDPDRPCPHRDRAPRMLLTYAPDHLLPEALVERLSSHPEPMTRLLAALRARSPLAAHTLVMLPRISRTTRLLALDVLIEHGAPERLRAVLRQCAARDDHWLTARLVEHVVRTERQHAASYLLDALERAAPSSSIPLIEASTHAWRSTWIPPLRERIVSSDLHVRHAAARLLARHAPDHARCAVVSACGHPNPRIASENRERLHQDGSLAALRLIDAALSSGRIRGARAAELHPLLIVLRTKHRASTSGQLCVAERMPSGAYGALSAV